MRAAFACVACAKLQSRAGCEAGRSAARARSSQTKAPRPHRQDPDTRAGALRKDSTGRLLHDAAGSTRPGGTSIAVECATGPGRTSARRRMPQPGGSTRSSSGRPLMPTSRRPLPPSQPRHHAGRVAATARPGRPVPRQGPRRWERVREHSAAPPVATGGPRCAAPGLRAGGPTRWRFRRLPRSAGSAYVWGGKTRPGFTPGGRLGRRMAMRRWSRCRAVPCGASCNRW